MNGIRQGGKKNGNKEEDPPTIFSHDPDVHAVANLDVEGGLLLLHLVEEAVCKMFCVITTGWQRRHWLGPLSRGQTTS